MATATNLFSDSQQPQSGFEFPQSLTEKYQPKRFQDFAGLAKPKAIFSKFCAKPYSSAWLFLGSSGTGKTTFSLAICKALDGELHHIPSQDCNLDNIERVRRTCQYVPMSGKRFHVILIDEADQMTPAAQLKMLSYLDATNFPPSTIFILTCNATDRLEARFLSRLRVVEFSSYGIAGDVTKLLESVWNTETGSNSNRPHFARIVKESNNNARESLMKLETELLAL